MSVRNPFDPISSGSAASLVDYGLGEAYETVKYVRDNLADIAKVANVSEDVSELSTSMGALTSAYNMAVTQGFVGSMIEWLANINAAGGVPGAMGPQGPQGAQGAQGLQGPSGINEWGEIEGDLGDQIDLSQALALKAPLASPTFTGVLTFGDELNTPAASVDFIQDDITWLTTSRYTSGVTGNEFVQLTFKNVFVNTAGNKGGFTWGSNIISRSSETTGAVLLADSEYNGLTALANLNTTTFAGAGTIIVENTGTVPTAANQILGLIFGRGKWDTADGNNPAPGFLAFVSGGAWLANNTPMDVVLGATPTGSSLAVERLRIKGSGGIKVSGGPIELENGQITFPAIENPSTNANTLDHYAEVAFVPVLKFGGASTDIAYNVAATVGQATKIGRLVQFDLNITLTNVGTATGTATIEGLPFTQLNANPTTNPTVNIFGGAATITTPMSTLAVNIITLRHQSGGTYSALNNTHFANTTSIRVTGFYRTA